MADRDDSLRQAFAKLSTSSNEDAFSRYFGGDVSGHQQSSKSSATTQTLNKLFDKYCEDTKSHPDTIKIDGTMKYLGDLAIPLESIAILVIFEMVKSPTMGEIPRAEFVQGWTQHGASTITAQKSVITALTASLRTPEAHAKDGLYRRVYKHTFRIALPTGTRAVPLDMALEYWRLLFGPQGWEWRAANGSSWLESWEEFLNTRWKKAVNKDLWDQTLLFAEQTVRDPSLSWWSEESAWPGIIDEFVGWIKEQRQAQNAEPNGAMEVDG